LNKGERRETEVAVHRRRAFEQAFERVPAQSERGREADRRPERIAAADRLGKRQDPRLVDAERDRLVRARGERDDPAADPPDEQKQLA